MSKFVIKIILNKKVVAVSSSDYQEWNVISATNYIIEMLKNYNLDLCNVILAEPLFAIRFLDVDNIYGMKGDPATKCIIKEESQKYISENYPYFYHSTPKKHMEDCGLVAITENDMKEELRNAVFTAVIDLDKSKVGFFGFYDEMDPKEWKNDTVSGSLSIDDLDVIPYDYTNLPFNYLNEFHRFIENNFNGWFIKGRSDIVVVPRSRIDI